MYAKLNENNFSLSHTVSSIFQIENMKRKKKQQPTNERTREKASDYSVVSTTTTS